MTDGSFYVTTSRELGMRFRWRATIGFDYPLLDQPANVGDMQIFPAPLEFELDPRCVHFFEFETDQPNRAGQKAAMRAAELRMDQLRETSALCGFYCEVSLHSVVLIEAHEGKGLPAAGLNFESAPEKSYIAPGTDPIKYRMRLESAGDKLKRLDEASEPARTAVLRALRWIYRSDDYRALSEDRLIYLWIGFNCLYGQLAVMLSVSRRYERDQYRNYHREIATSVNINPNERHRNIVMSADIAHKMESKDSSSKETADRIERDSFLQILDQIYAIRCALFHGEIPPTSDQNAALLSSAFELLRNYLHVTLPCLIERIAPARENSP